MQQAHTAPLVLGIIQNTTVIFMTIHSVGMFTILTLKTAIVIVVFLFSHNTAGIPLANFTSYGFAAGDNLVPSGDDIVTANLLSSPFPYYGVDRTSIFVSSYIYSEHEILRETRGFKH